jgi:hypothetical protein
MPAPAYDRFLSRFSTLTAKSRAGLQTPSVQPSPPVYQQHVVLSRFATLSDKSRAQLVRPSPAQQADHTAAPATPSPGISVDEAWSLFGIKKKRGTKEEIKGIYLKLVAKHHPDRNPEDPVAAHQQTVKINAAYAALKRHCKF